MGLLSFFKIYFLIFFSTIYVRALDNRYFEDTKEALQVASCVARCEKNKACRRECFERDNGRLNAIIFGETGPRFSGTAHFNATLHCKDIDVIKIRHNSGIWVIEETDSHDDSWKNFTRIRVSDKTVTSFRNLTAGTSYRYKAYRIIADGIISEPEVSPWFSTFEMDHRPEKVSNIEIANQTLDDRNPFRLRADIIFQPASDRSCRYDVVSWGEDEGLTIAQFESSQDFRFSLHNLDYVTNVTVFVAARVMGNSPSNSDNASLVFVTPSCIQMHRNLTVCAPDQVKGLRVNGMYENKSNYEIFVGWDEPTLIPETYVVQFLCLNYEDKETSLVTIPGNSTEVLLTLAKDEVKDCQRVISIIAESLGGTSAQSWIYLDSNEILDFTSKNDTRAIIGRTFLFADGITIATSVVLFTFVVAIVYAYHLWRHKISARNDKNGYNKYCQSLNGGGKNLDISFYDMGKGAMLEFENKYPLIPKDRFEIRPVQLTIKDVLGSGASGIVRLGRFQTHKNHLIDVAVKTLKDDPSAEDLKNFRREISIMKSAGCHPNIVSIIGCCTHDVKRPLLVVEYCSRGDLQTYLRTLWQEIMSQALERRSRCKIGIPDNGSTDERRVENAMSVTSWIVDHQVAITNKLYDIQEGYINVPKDDDEVTAEDLLNFACQVASGMEFLSSNRIIHRDLAARNVLVCSDKTVKISDFGLSRDVYQENVYKKQGSGRLPLKWMAIEALTHQIYTTKSDVWSFGILLWEIVTLGCNPYPETPTNMVLQLLKSGYRMKKPKNCGNELYGIMRSCWHSRPRSRPNFTQLKNQLDKLLRTTTGDEHLNILRESADSPKHVDVNHYSNIYSK